MDCSHRRSGQTLVAVGMHLGLASSEEGTFLVEVGNPDPEAGYLVFDTLYGLSGDVDPVMLGLIAGLEERYFVSDG